ncbi:MAG: DUF445 family protein [Clostridiales bacterium]|jgi:uncharacterized membrane-anchored protein YjiN (DUF445 family)|nr:DUF445 family protein [Eubacteriales bacterium]MDH7567501.1 DUF445 family protein [Clostridiales bacterium]
MLQMNMEEIFKSLGSKVNTGPGVSRRQLGEMEKRLRVRLPRSCRRYLIQYGSTEFGSTIILEWGGEKNNFVRYTEDGRTAGLPETYVVIEKNGKRLSCVDTGFEMRDRVKIVSWEDGFQHETVYPGFEAYLLERLRQCFGQEEIESAIKYGEKVKKLKRMKGIATGLLGLMAAIYFVFKRFQSYGLFYSSVVAFSEAAMIGSLADWFAVVALFKHPMGMSWIPHTAIIPRNKEKLGDSLAGFVVSNFFNEENIKARLENMDFSSELLSQLSKHREAIARWVVDHFPSTLELLLGNRELTSSMAAGLRDKLKDTEVHGFIESLLELLVSSGYHIAMVKGLLEFIYAQVKSDKEKTLRMVESVDKKLALPFIRDIVYKSIVDSLEKQVYDFRTNDQPELGTLILHNLEKFVQDLKTSPKLIEKVDRVKRDLLDSEDFRRFTDGALQKIKDALVSYGANSGEKLNHDVKSLLVKAEGYLSGDAAMRQRFDRWIRNSMVEVVCEYRFEIGRLISNTVREWRLEDMVDKLEAQVGGDLQYIRINGTVIGGLAGLGIHLLSVLLHF